MVDAKDQARIPSRNIFIRITSFLLLMVLLYHNYRKSQVVILHKFSRPKLCNLYTTRNSARLDRRRAAQKHVDFWAKKEPPRRAV